VTRGDAAKFDGGGFDDVHSAIDAYSGVAYSEILPSNDAAVPAVAAPARTPPTNKPRSRSSTSSPHPSGDGTART
jgi:hypothetical protein